MSSKISAVEVIPFRVPLKHPVVFAAGVLEHLDHVLVRVTCDDGKVGHAEVPARQMIYGETVASIVTAVEDYLGPPLIGLEINALERVHETFRSLANNHCAKAGLDVALYDLLAQTAGIPLFRYLGGYRDSVAVCHILGTGEPAAVAEEARSLAARYGLHWFKLKAGLDPEVDTARIAAVRSALGPKARLTVDCNQAYPAAVAECVLPTWEKFDLSWIEEPCPGSDPIGRARVASASHIPLMIDESAYVLTDLAREAFAGSCRIFALKLARSGITGARRIMALAEAHGIATVVGGQAEAELGAMTSAHFAAAHRATALSSAEVSFFLDAADRITVETIGIKNGCITLPAQPGLGIEIDEERLRRLRYD